VTAFMFSGIECLRQIIADERVSGSAPPPVKPDAIAQPAVLTAYCKRAAPMRRARQVRLDNPDGPLTMRGLKFVLAGIC